MSISPQTTSVPRIPGSNPGGPAAPQRPSASRRHMPRGVKTTLVVIGIILAVIVAVGIGHKLGLDEQLAKDLAAQAAKPADTVPAKSDLATTVSAPTTCEDDQRIYMIPADGRPVKELKGDKWVDPAEASISLAAPYDRAGMIGDVVVAATPGEGVSEVKVARLYVWNVTMTDKYKAALNVTQYKPDELKSSAHMEETGLKRDSIIMACLAMNA